ncbi:prepilin peptidase [Helicobacter sp. 11S03491-1]|uniref:prepilin peptidase n=1 Tax=Helicobacter sp. 11S03491-1 TaxID=1476196 RepID=UPI000BDD8881|nr:prepilin peptidase [Helicobacter sp. 11S03491-1]PAF41820.1 hypothetical protein BKH45_05785 [Helicobacter sp. 11S03491-1]
MSYDLFVFGKNHFLYFLISPGHVGIDGLGLGLLGWILFEMSKYLNTRYCLNVFTKRISNISILIILMFFGFGIAYFYKGIFEIWLMVVLTLMFLLAFIDYKILGVPDWMNFALLFCIVLGCIYFGGENILLFDMFFEGLGLAGLFAILRIFGDMIYKKEILGEGDIVFGASSGLLFGIYNSLIAIFWGCVFASILVLFFKILGKNILKIPLITFMFIGLFFCFVMGIIL